MLLLFIVFTKLYINCGLLWRHYFAICICIIIWVLMQYGDNIIEPSLRKVLVSGETEVWNLLLMDRANEITEPPPTLALSM